VKKGITAKKKLFFKLRKAKSRVPATYGDRVSIAVAISPATRVGGRGSHWRRRHCHGERLLPTWSDAANRDLRV
jgi:hypothetical protein